MSTRLIFFVIKYDNKLLVQSWIDSPRVKSVAIFTLVCETKGFQKLGGLYLINIPKYLYIYKWCNFYEEKKEFEKKNYLKTKKKSIYFKILLKTKLKTNTFSKIIAIWMLFKGI